MDKNEIKKLVYKKNPIASLDKIRKGAAHYSCAIWQDNGVGDGDTTTLRFEVPISDMGDADFLPVMNAKLLLRWLKILNFEEKEN